MRCIIISEHDSLERRCPKLGHEIRFSYCRQPGSDIPCNKIFDCWWQTFDIQSFMNEHYSSEILQSITAGSQPKVLSLIELIQQAQERAKKKQ